MLDGVELDAADFPAWLLFSEDSIQYEILVSDMAAGGYLENIQSGTYTITLEYQLVVQPEATITIEDYVTITIAHMCAADGSMFLADPGDGGAHTFTMGDSGIAEYYVPSMSTYSGLNCGSYTLDFIFFRDGVEIDLPSWFINYDTVNTDRVMTISKEEITSFGTYTVYVVAHWDSHAEYTWPEMAFFDLQQFSEPWLTLHVVNNGCLNTQL